VTLLFALIDRWRRRNHADLRIILTPDMAPEPRTRQFVTVYLAVKLDHLGSVLRLTK
jgi:hypothetical protein